MTVFALETPTNTETPTEYRRPPYLAVMIEMCADGYGYEDIHIELKKMGFSVPLAACRRFVMGPPKRTTAPIGADGGRFAACDGAAADAER
jgi:hypothetical protein